MNAIQQKQRPPTEGRCSVETPSPVAFSDPAEKPGVIYHSNGRKAAKSRRRAQVWAMAASQQEQHLAQSNRHIAEFERRVTEQEARVAEIQRDGRSTHDALTFYIRERETLRLGIELRLYPATHFASFPIAVSVRSVLSSLITPR
jgi:hypothetical protein